VIDLKRKVPNICEMKATALNFIRFLNTLSSALVMGIVFGVWIGFNPYHLSAGAYIEQQQNLILGLNELMPILGLGTILLTLFSAYYQRENKRTAFLLVIASIFFIASGLVTRFGNQLINAEMILWDPLNPPVNWTQLRDKWWTLHSFRTGTALAGLVLVTFTNTKVVSPSSFKNVHQ